MVIVGQDLPVWVFAAHTETGWALLGLVVLLNAPARNAPSDASAALQPA